MKFIFDQIHLQAYVFFCLTPGLKCYIIAAAWIFMEIVYQFLKLGRSFFGHGALLEDPPVFEKPAQYCPRLGGGVY